MVNEVHVAVAVIQRGNEILIAKRPDGAHQGGLWEFPGGKVEPDETVQQALKRELQEELGITVDLNGGVRPLRRIRHDYGDKAVLLDVWVVERFTGVPVGVEGQPIRWVKQCSLVDYAFPEANTPIVKTILLPKKYLITGVPGSVQESLARLRQAITCHDIQLVQLRAHDLLDSNVEEFLVMAGEVLELCRDHHTLMVLNGAPELLKEIDADGVHLPFHVANEHKVRPVCVNKYFGISCHNAVQLERAKALKPDYVFLSPVLKTTTHPDVSPLGWELFGELVDRVDFPVYALGGLGEGDIEVAIKQGAQGVAAISAWW